MALFVSTEPVNSHVMVSEKQPQSSLVLKPGGQALPLFLGGERGKSRLGRERESRNRMDGEMVVY